MELKDRTLKLTPKRIEQLHSLGLDTDTQLLSYYPFRYDIRETKPFETWQLKDKVFFEGTLCSRINTVRFGRHKTMTKFDVMAMDRILHITIFNRPWAKQIDENQILSIQGIYMGNNRVTATNYSTKPLSEQDAIVPQYSTKADIQQRTIRESIRKVLEIRSSAIVDLIPQHFIISYRLLHKAEALRQIHFPNTKQEIVAAYRTLKYEEFLKFFLTLQMMKKENTDIGTKEKRYVDIGKIEAWEKSLPFEMTSDQKKALQAVISDMCSDHLMYRLIQGDVGCGKTAVAAGALYAACTGGYQAALLAPTEILARQHFESVGTLLKDTGLRIEVLYSGQKTSEKQRIIDSVRNGTTDLLIGTHSILQENVVFHHLGLVVADEQQRFGVAQRRTLREKGEHVDFLLMSATPIPRTLASTLYGDMDVSTIETMPKGRKPVVTELIRENSFRSVLNEVRSLLKSGRQLYVICAAVEDSEDYDARSVFDVTNSLKKLFAGEYEVDMLHGRMNSDEKQEVMNRFEQNDVQVLVSTTVVEVGVNVVNATAMIVYDADRFGLSQLHQLRGRIQRGSETGYCWLLTDSKDDRALERLNVLVKSANGFDISYEDLRLRGPGDILGTKQSGIPDFVLGNPIEDAKIVQQAQIDALYILEHPEETDHESMIRTIREENIRNIRYID